MRSKYSLADHPEARQRALWLIRDYPHLIDRLSALDGYGSGGSDGGSRSSDIHSSVESIAIKRAALADQAHIIEHAFERVPEEYREHLWKSIILRQRYPDTAGIKTWKRWRQRVLWWVAHDAGFID